VLLDTVGNGWMPRAIRVAEQTGAPRSMVVTNADTFVRVVNKLFQGYMHRVDAPKQLRMTPETAAALRTLNGLPVAVNAEGQQMLTKLRLVVEKAAAQPGFGEQELRTELIPLLSEYGGLGLKPGQYRTQPIAVGVNAVSSDASKVPRTPFKPQAQKDAELKRGAPSTEPPGQRPTGNRSTSPGGGQGQQRQTGNRSATPGGGQGSQRRPEQQPLHQAPATQQEGPRQQCNLGQDCPYLNGVRGPGWCRKHHSTQEQQAADRAAHQRRAAGPRQDGRMNAPTSPRAGPQQQHRDGQQYQRGGQQQQQTQNVLNQQYQDFLNQENAPYKQLNFMSDIIRGTPTTALGSSMYQSPPSLLNQVAGLGTAAAGLFGAYNQANKNAKGGAIKAKKPQGGLPQLLVNSMG
jgi:hypothetical protein